MQPWCDRSGHVSALKLTVFLALVLPGAWTALGLALHQLGARPLTEAIHQTGRWAIRLLLLSLAVTPLRLVLQWPRLILVRRMIGVAAFAYGSAHLTLYAADQAFDLARVASEIALRLYLTIGFATLLILATLAGTSTEGMIRRLGGRAWRWLHRLAYAAGLLALTHYFMQSKLALGEPLLMTSLFAWLMGHRLIGWLAGDHRPAWALAGMSVLLGLAIAGGQAGYLHFTIGADPGRVLAANLAWTVGCRSSWAVAVLGLALTAAGSLRRHFARRIPARLAPLPAIH
jgi:sulfoxide reductase heme-binding subunit YedZ